MNNWFLILTIGFIIVAAAMVLIVLVQRPQGGGLAAAFGGAGGSGGDTVFGGRVGDALTWATVVAFLLYLTLAISLNLVPVTPPQPTATTPVLTTPTGDPADVAPGGDAGLSTQAPAETVDDGLIDEVPVTPIETPPAELELAPAGDGTAGGGEDTDGGAE